MRTQNDAYGAEAIEMIRTMWERGDSCRQIAHAVNAKFSRSYSRNAIIGKIHRLGLAGRQAPLRQKPSPPKRAPAKPRSPVVATSAKVAPKARTSETPWRGVGDPSVRPQHAALGGLGEPCNKRLVDLGPNECKMPVGPADGAGQLFCAAPMAKGQSYCPVCREVLGYKAQKPILHANGRLPRFARS